jgi:hypothetical protein
MLRAAIAGAAEARQTVSTHEAAIEKARALLKESELKLQPRSPASPRTRGLLPRRSAAAAHRLREQPARLVQRRPTHATKSRRHELHASN